MSYTKVWEGGKMYENSCECNGFGGEMRRFLTKEEKVEILKAYKEGLQKEVKAVEERIKELGKNN
jgi:hypothetical protein